MHKEQRNGGHKQGDTEEKSEKDQVVTAGIYSQSLLSPFIFFQYEDKRNKLRLSCAKLSRSCGGGIEIKAIQPSWGLELGKNSLKMN